MSEVIDQRTVEMRFDNQNFEKNVESSLGTIDKLKKSLNFQDSVKGLETFEKSLNSINLKNVKESVDGVSDSFKNMINTVGNVYLIKRGVDAFKGLESAAKNMIKSMVGINNMKAGWTKYESKINSVQTIMNATGRTIDDVSNALDKLNWYSDETSASFSDMVDNIGKFTSAGVKLEDAVAAMQGVFNWASTSGGNKSQAARAMYNLSQAISVGSMKLMDWKSIENAQMSTIEFKQTVLDTGVALGKLTKTGDKFYTKVGKKQEITTKNFSSTLNTGWLDSELLVSVLKRYSEFSDKVYQYMEEHPEIDTAITAMDEMRKEALSSGKAFDELGYKWFLAAQQAKTFTDVVDSVKDAVSTGWMKTFEFIFGNYEQARVMWSDLAEDLYEVFATPLSIQNDFLSEVLTSNYAKLKKEIIKAGLSVEEFEERIYKSAESNEEDKKKLDELILKYRNLSNAIDAGKVPMEIIRKAFVQLTESGEEVKKTIPTLEEVQQIIKDTWAGKYGNDNERFEAYRNLGYDAQKLQRLVSIYTKKGKIELSDLKEVGIEVGQTYSKTWKELIDSNEDLFNSLDELSGRELIIDSFRITLKNLFKGTNALREGIGEVFSFSPETVKSFLQNVHNISSAFELSDERAEQFKELVVAIGQPIRSVGIIAKKFIGEMIGDSFDGLLPKIKKYYGTAFDNVYTYFGKVAKLYKSFEDSAYVNKAIKKFSEAFHNFSIDTGIKFDEIGKKIKGYFQKTFISSAINKYVTRWNKIWSEMNAGGKNAFDTLIRAGKEFRKQWIDTHGEGWNFISALKDGLKRDFDKFQKSKLAEKINSKIVNILDKIFGKESSVKILFNAVKFSQSIQKGFNLLKSNFKSSWFGEQFRTIGTAYQRALNAFKNTFSQKENSVFDSIKAGLIAFWKTFKYGTKGKKSKFGETIEKIFSDLLPKDSFISKLIGNIKEKFSSIADAISSVFKKKDKKRIKGSLGSDDGFLDQFQAKLAKFWNWAKPLLQIMAETFAKSFNLQNISQFINAITGLLFGINFSKVSSGFGKFLTSLSEQTGEFLTSFNGQTSEFFSQHTGILATIKDILTNVKNYSLTDRLRETLTNLVDAFSPLKDTKRELKARSVMEFAIALGIVAGALYLISGISVPDLVKAGIVVAAIAAALVGIGALISHFGDVKFQVALSGTGQMLKLIALILAISIALKNVGKAAQGIATAVDILINAVEKFSDLAVNKIKFQEGIRAVQDLILALGAASFMAGFLTIGNLFGGTALTILSFAGAIRILYDAIEKITVLSLAAPDNLDQSIKAIGELIIKLGQSAALAGLTNGSWKDAGAAETILALTGAIEILQNAIIALAAIPAKKLENSVNAVTNLLNSLGKASFWSGFLSNGLGGFGRAATIFAFGKSIEMLVGSIESIMKLSVNKERFKLASDTVNSILSTLEWMSIILGVANRFGAKASMSQATGIIAFGFAIRIIGESIEGLGKLNKERLVQGGNAVGLIGTLIAGFTGVLGAVNKWLNLSIKELGSAAMIIAFGTAIGSIANTVIKLADLDAKKMEKGLNATWSIAGIVAALTAVSSLFNKGAKFSGFNFMTIAAGLYIFGQAIEKLGGLDDKVLLKGGAAVSALSLVIASCIALMNIGAKVPSWTNAVNIAALASSVWVLSEAAKTFANLNGSQLIKAGGGVIGLLAALTAISKWGLASGNVETLLNSLSLLVLTGAVSLLAQLAKSFADYEWPQMAKIGSAFFAILIGIRAMSTAISAGAKISFGAIAKFAAVVVEIGGILALIGGLMQIFPSASGLMTSGGDFLMHLGSALGKFIGGIGGGIGEALAASMPAVGQSLADFAKNAKPFFDTIKDLNGLDVGAILLSLVAAEHIATINEGIGRLLAIFNKNGFEFTTMQAFGTGLSAVAPGVEALIAATKDGDPSKITAVTGALKELRHISGIKVLSGDENPLADFAGQITAASTSIEEAVNALNGLPTLTNNASTVIQSLIDFSNGNFGKSGISLSGNASFNLGEYGTEGVKLPNFESNVQLIIEFGNKTKEYTDKLKEAVPNIKEFFEEAQQITVEVDEASGKSKVQILSEALSAMAGINVPQAYTFHADIITRFAKDLKDSMEKVKEFITDLNENFVPADKTKFEALKTMLQDLSTITMPINYGDSGYMNFEQMVSEYSAALLQIHILAEQIKSDYAGDMEIVSKLVDVFKPFTLSKDEINLDVLTEIPDRIKTFVDDLNKTLAGATVDENVSNSILGLAELLSTDMKEIGFSEAASDITGGLNNLASINQDNGAETLTPATETINTFVDVVKKLMRIQNDFKETTFSNNLNKMITMINENMSKLTSGSRTNMNRMREFFESVKELYGDKYHFETGAGNKFGTLISALVSAIDMFSPNTSIDDLKAYTDWMEDLAGKQDMFESAGKAIGAFAVNTDKLNSVTSFIDALKGDFHFTPGRYDFVSNPGETGGHWEEMPGYFSKIANDIVLALRILKGTDENNPLDFAEFDTLTLKLSSLATAMAQFTGTNNVSEKMKALVKGINDAILGDNTEENPGIKDFGDRLSQFDSLQPVFSQLSDWDFNGLKDVVPNILSGITNAINNFSFDPNGIQLLKEAMTGIRESLDILNGGEGGPKNRLFSTSNKGGRNRVSKASDVIEKIEKKNQNGFNLVDTSKAKNMGIIDLAFAIDNLADSYERLNEETDEDRAKRISEETDKMESYYQSSIKDYESYKNLYDRYVEAHPGSENPLSFWDLLFNYDPELDNPYREEMNRASRELEKTKAEYEKLLELDKELNPEKYIPVQNDVIEETLNETLGSSDLFINAIEGIADAVNGIEIDQSKTDLLVNLAESISEAAEGISKDSPSSMAKFVQVLADSIADNSDITHQSADILIQGMLTVLENYIEKFITAGVNFVKAISSGIENTPDAVEMAATMATRILTQFTLAAQTFGGQKGKEMLDSVLGGLTSPESKEAVDAAFESLFGSDENFGIDTSGESGSIGKRIGSTFAADFMEGFSTNLNFGEGDNFGGVFQSITELVSQLSSMDGNEAGMEFSTFMTDFATSAAKVMEGDAGKKIQETCDTLSSAIGSAVPDGEGLGYSFVEGIRDGLLRGIADFGAEISMLAGYLGGLMNSGTATVIQSASPSKTAMQLGGYFVEGLKLGIEKNLGQAYGAGASVGNAAIDGTTKTLDINSPSKVLYGIGEYAVDGFVEGVKHTTGEATGAFSDMANLSIDEAMTLIRMLQNASGPVSFKGRTWNKSDIDYLRQYISSLQNATSATEKLSKNMESVSDTGGPVKNGASGGGGNGQSSDKKNNNVITTDVKGNKLTIHEVGTVLKGIIENGGFKSSYEYNGTEYNFKDLPREFISANKDYFTKMFGNYEGFIPGLESLLSINHEALNNVGDGINKLSNVWEFDEIKVGLTKDAIYSLSEQQSGLFNSAVNRIISGTAQSTKHEQSNSVSSSNSDSKTTGGNVYNFNQHIVGSKAASRAEIYRQTKNQFSQLKALDSKSAPYVPILT